MHYNDKEVIDSQEIVLSIYKHDVSDGSTETNINSIISVKMIYPYLLSKLFSCHEYILADTYDKIEAEEFYVIKLRIKDMYDINSIEVIEVRKAITELEGLH